MNLRLLLYLSLPLASTIAAQANLIVKVDEPKRTGEKAVVRLTMKNTFKEKIESARAQVFLVDDQNKTHSAGARWVIGSGKDRPALAPGATTTYNFVITTDKELKVKNVMFSKIVFGGGKEAEVNNSVTIEMPSNDRPQP